MHAVNRRKARVLGVDVVLGVAVSGRTAQLAMVGSPATGGELFDQYELEFADDATAELAETIIGTDRALAESGNRLAATRLYFAEPSQAETLRQALLNGGVADVEAVSENEAVTAATQGIDAGTLQIGDDRFALARGAAKSVGGVALVAADPFGPPTQMAPVDPAGPVTQMAPINNSAQSADATQLAPAAPYEPATQLAPTSSSDQSAAPTGIDGAVGPQLAYSIDETDGSYEYGLV